jgi:UDP-N-acetylglucosamine 2-epimerase
LDSLRLKPRLSRDQTAERFHFNAKQPIVLAIQHPVTTEYSMAAKNMKAFSDAVIGLGQQTVYIQSNADAGNRAMTAVMKRQMARMAAQPFIRVFKNLPHNVYISVMSHAKVMIGNSSSGLIEAPAFRTPYVLVGTRQQGREQASNVIEVPYKTASIRRAAERFLNGHRITTFKNPYDPFLDGGAGERIANIVSKIPINMKLIQKRLAY